MLFFVDTYCCPFILVGQEIKSRILVSCKLSYCKNALLMC